MQGSFEQALHDFVLPEKEVTAKLLFDNVRNTLIGITLGSAAKWASVHQEALGVAQDLAWYLVPYLFVVAFLLLALSLVQGFYITERLIYQWAPLAKSTGTQILAIVGIIFVSMMVPLGAPVYLVILMTRGGAG